MGMLPLLISSHPHPFPSLPAPRLVCQLAIPKEVEGIVGRSKFISQVFVYGDSTQATLVAIVVPDRETVEPWLREQGIEGDFETAAKDPKV